MDIRPLTPDFAVSAQISVEDVAQIAAAGYRTIICNRPDGESADQVPQAQIEQAAKAAGLSFQYLPIVPGVIEDSHLSAFDALMADTPTPILAYCRTGTRCSAWWSLASAKTLSEQDILDATAQAGYDMSSLKPALQAYKTR